MAESLYDMWTLLMKRRAEWPVATLLIGVTATVATYYLKYVAKKPVLITGSKSCADFLQHHCPVLVQEYYPTVWCFTSQAHTLLCSVLYLFPLQKPLLITGSKSCADFLQHHCPVLVQEYYPTVWCFTSRAHTILCSVLYLFPLQKPVLITGSKSCADFLQHHCPVLVQEYYPTVWCFTSRAHTILCSVLYLFPLQKPVLITGSKSCADFLQCHCPVLVQEYYPTVWCFTSRAHTILCSVLYLFSLQKPVLITGSKSCADFLQHHCPVLVQEYYPTVWCFTSRAHTILCSIAGNLAKKLPPYRKDILPTPDGGEIHLEWLDHHGNDCHDNRTCPIVVILPGLSGNSASHYAIRLAKGATKKCYRGVVFNHRGSNGVKLKSNRLYCAADSEDFQLVVSHIKKLYPDAPLMAVGCSMGGMILFNYLAKHGENCGLVAAMVVGMPWEANKTGDSLQQPLNRLVFNKNLVRQLRRDLRFNRDLFDNDDRVDVDYTLQSSTVKDFDDRFTIKLFGFDSVRHYYTTASACYKINRVKIPLLSLNSADDVFAPFDSIPTEDIKKNPNISLVVTSHGGHVGFGDWLSPTRESFLDKLYQQYIDAVFKYGEKELKGTHLKK
ncbi:phospholipase ABHD3-like [Branchiostoma floridae]|uniref:Phospholipase ABHD3 n=1 Tax=Branchiostoma floridae TaxID=7739 RepID=A0A9J7HIK0_BRAFL|nr:phospholipase ABHD3-like [Branchiostoma floridae]